MTDTPASSSKTAALRQQVRGHFSNSMTGSSQMMTSPMQSSQPPAQSAPPQPTPQVSLDDSLQIAQKVLDDVAATRDTNSQTLETVPADPLAQSQFSQVLPAAVDQASDALNNQNNIQIQTSFKETAQPISPEQSVMDALPGGQYIEQEPSPEMSPEIESFVEHVAEHPDQLPDEITVAGDDIAVLPTHTLRKPVVVLPITPEEEQQGKKQGTQSSFRWLVEWSRKIMKLFQGRVVYREG